MSGPDAARCPRCARFVQDDATFCSHCGAELRARGTTTTGGGPSEAVERIADELRAALAPRYELLDLLGEGGMGFVFRAREESLRRLVAVKVLSPTLAENERARDRFAREARAVAAISHANVIGVYGVGETTALGLPFIVMQYVDGPTLSAWARTHSHDSEASARRIVAEVASALAAAHTHGVIHRDVKPSNVLIEATTGRAIVVDFGVSALRGSGDTALDTPHLTTTGIVVGTPVYMSPEQAAGEHVDAPSDIYSLGILAYELFAGDLPFKATSAMGWAAAHMRDVPSPLIASRPELSPEVAQLVDRCLEKDPKQRPRAQEIAAGMSLSVENEIQWPPAGLAAMHRRGRVLARVTGVAAVAAIAIALCLAFPPALARADHEWWTRYAEGRDVSGSVLGVVNETGTGSPPTLMWVWRILMASGLVAAVVAAIGFVAIAAPIAVRAARARTLGWRWSTIADVLGDPDGRNGLLLVGARELAGLERERRVDALRARRRQVAAVIAAGGWAYATLGIWAAGAVLGVARLDGSGPLMTLPVLLFIVVPAIAALAAAIGAGREERRALAPLPRRRPHAASGSSRVSSMSSEGAAAWYAPLHEESATGGISVASVRALAGAISAGIVGATFAVGLVIAATFVAAQNLERLGPETARLAATLRRLRESDLLGDARRSWAAYLPSAPPLSIADAGDVLRRLSGADAARALPPYATAPSQMLGTIAVSNPRPAVAEAIKGAANGLPLDSMTLFAAVAIHARTEWVRRLAAPGTDLFSAMLDRPLADYRALSDLAEPPYQQLRAGAQANALAAVVAVAKRDFAEAERRLGENAALAERFLEVPRRFASTFGAGLLQELSLLPLAEVEDLRGNPGRGVELRHAAETVRDLVLDPVWSSRHVGLAATPNDLRAYAAAVGDPHVPAGLRAEGLAGSFLGYCLNAREVIGGPSRRREDAMRHVTDSAGDRGSLGALPTLAYRDWQTRHGLGNGSMASEYVLTRIMFCSNVSHR